MVAVPGLLPTGSKMLDTPGVPHPYQIASQLSADEVRAEAEGGGGGRGGPPDARQGWGGRRRTILMLSFESSCRVLGRLGASGSSVLAL